VGLLLAGVVGAGFELPLPIVMAEVPLAEQVMTFVALISSLMIFDVLQSKDSVPVPTFNPWKVTVAKVPAVEIEEAGSSQYKPFPQSKYHLKLLKKEILHQLK